MVVFRQSPKKTFNIPKPVGYLMLAELIYSICSKLIKITCTAKLGFLKNNRPRLVCILEKVSGVVFYFYFLKNW